MKKRDIIENIKHICALAAELTDMEYRERDDDLPVAFVRMSGHTGQIDIHLYENGWKPAGDTGDDGQTAAYCVYYHGGYSKSESPERFPEIIAEMNRLIDVKLKRILAKAEQAQDATLETWERGGGEAVLAPELCTFMENVAKAAASAYDKMNPEDAAACKEDDKRFDDHLNGYDPREVV